MRFISTPSLTTANAILLTTLRYGHAPDQVMELPKVKKTTDRWTMKRERILSVNSMARTEILSGGRLGRSR